MKITCGLLVTSTRCKKELLSNRHQREAAPIHRIGRLELTRHFLWAKTGDRANDRLCRELAWAVEVQTAAVTDVKPIDWLLCLQNETRKKQALPLYTTTYPTQTF